MVSAPSRFLEVYSVRWRAPVTALLLGLKPPATGPSSRLRDLEGAFVPQAYAPASPRGGPQNSSWPYFDYGNGTARSAAHAHHCETVLWASSRALTDPVTQTYPPYFDSPAFAARPPQITLASAPKSPTSLDYFGDHSAHQILEAISEAAVIGNHHELETIKRCVAHQQSLRQLENLIYQRGHLAILFVSRLIGSELGLEHPDIPNPRSGEALRDSWVVKFGRSRNDASEVICGYARYKGLQHTVDKLAELLASSEPKSIGDVFGCKLVLPDSQACRRVSQRLARTFQQRSLRSMDHFDSSTGRWRRSSGWEGIKFRVYAEIQLDGCRGCVPVEIQLVPRVGEHHDEAGRLVARAGQDPCVLHPSSHACYEHKRRRRRNGACGCGKTRSVLRSLFGLRTWRKHSWNVRRRSLG
ncbi:MAG: hypothetical protein AAF355_08880 [Myxococcota bacterium]